MLRHVDPKLLTFLLSSALVALASCAGASSVGPLGADETSHRGDAAALAPEGLGFGGPGACAQDNFDPPATGAAPAAGAPTDRLVVQRDASNVGSIPVAGNAPAGTFCVDALPLNEAGAPATGWQPIALSGASFNGHITAPAGPGWLKVLVRAWQGQAGQRIVGIATIDRVGVGDVFVIAGQSNMSNSGAQRLTVTDDHVSAFTGGGWQIANDPQPLTAGTGGSVWPTAGSSLAAMSGVPIAFVNVSVPGSFVAAWLPGSANFEGGPGHVGLRTAINLFGAGGVKAVLWGQGESDTSKCTKTATYQASLTAIAREVAKYGVKFVVATDAYGGTFPNVNRCEGAIEQAQQRTVKALKGIAFAGPNTDYLTGKKYRSPDADPHYNQLHFNATGSQAAGQAWASAVAKVPR